MSTRITMYDIFYSNLNSLKLQISQMASIEKNQDISLQLMTSIKTDSNVEGQIKINANSFFSSLIKMATS